VLLCAPGAWAIQPEPSPPPRLPGLGAAHAEPADPFYFMALSDQLGSVHREVPVRPLASEPRVVLSGFRHRRIKVIHYATPLRVAQNEMTLNLDAPGAGNAIVSLELEF
jgi:hypothetical protein